jgi:hypothetical protein
MEHFGYRRWTAPQSVVWYCHQGRLECFWNPAATSYRNAHSAQAPTTRGEMTLEHVMALAIHDDHAAQEEVLEAFDDGLGCFLGCLAGHA